MLSNSLQSDQKVSLSALRVLRPSDISQIEAALKKIGPSGEVHLLVEKGRLRYIRTLEKEALDGMRPL